MRHFPLGSGLWWGLCALACACATGPRPITKIVGGAVIETRSVDPNAYEHVARALLLEEEGRLQEAADEIARALNFDRESPELWGRKGELLLQLGQLEAAEEALHEADKRGPCVEALVARAHLLQARAQPVAALAPLERALALTDSAVDPVEAERVGMELGEAQLLALNLDSARKTFEALAAKLPRAMPPRVRLGAVAWALGDVDEAQRIWGEAALIDPGQIEALLSLAWLQAADGKAEKARKSFETALDRAEGAPEIGIVVARFLMSVGAADDARSLVEDLVAGDAREGSVELRAELLRTIKDVPGALKLLREAAAHTEDSNVKDRFRISEAELLADSPATKEEALRILTTIPLERDAGPAARLRASGLLRELDRLDAARNQLTALKIADEDDDLMQDWIVARALTEEKAGQRAQALQILDSFLLKHPTDERIVLTKAAIVERGGAWQAALGQVEALLLKKPSSPEALNFSGFVSVDHGHDVPRALLRLRAALALEPGSAAIIDSVGWALFRLGQLDPAGRFLEQAGRLEPEDPEILGHLAELSERRGDLRRAVMLIEKALTQKNDPDLRQKLEAVLRRLKGAAAVRATGKDG